MRLRMLWRNLTGKQKLEEDLNAELESYRQMLEDDKRTAREAALEMGGKEQIKEAVRDVRAGAWLDSFWAEVKQSVRGLARNPGTALLATSMLALGMTASTVIFSVFYAALVRPLPFREPDRLVEIWETRLSRGIDQASPSEANFWDVKARNHSFEEVAAAHDDELNMTGMGEPEKVKVLEVSANFLHTLGVQPILGRDFRAEDARDGWNTHVAIIGYKYWVSRFGGQQDIVGKTLRLNDHVYTIAGVLPPGEPWINKQLYVPFGYHADANRGSWEFGMIARLKPGVTVESARADLQIVASALGRAYASEDEGIGFRLEPSRRWVASNETRVALWVLLAAVVLLQVIACVNVANLLLARGLARQREIAVRTALGAPRALDPVRDDGIAVDQLLRDGSRTRGRILRPAGHSTSRFESNSTACRSPTEPVGAELRRHFGGRDRSIGRIGSCASRSHDSNCFDIARRRKTNGEPRPEPPAPHASHR